MNDLQGKVIVITGGAQGIGGATAELCAKRGATVVISDVNHAQGETLLAKLNTAGGSGMFIPTDVRDNDQVQQLFDTVQKKYGRLDGLVCAAGVLFGASQAPEELSVEDFEAVIDINTKGVFLCAKYATPLLEQSQGVMVVVASPAGVSGPSSSLAYAASKGGANGLAMTLAYQLEKRNIRVNTICPGSIKTQLKLDAEKQNAEKSGKSEEEVLQIADTQYGVPEGVAKMIAFMVSDEADYLRGVVYTR